LLRTTHYALFTDVGHRFITTRKFLVRQPVSRIQGRWAVVWTGQNEAGLLDFYRWLVINGAVNLVITIVILN
jgi:hypothetical protein